MTKIFQLSIPTIKCNGCVTAIKTALDNNDAVIKSEVNLETKSAIIEAKLTLSKLIAVIKASGFVATEQKAIMAEV